MGPWSDDIPFRMWNVRCSVPGNWPSWFFFFWWWWGGVASKFSFVNWLKSSQPSISHCIWGSFKWNNIWERAGKAAKRYASVILVTKLDGELGFLWPRAVPAWDECWWAPSRTWRTWRYRRCWLGGFPPEPGRVWSRTNPSMNEAKSVYFNVFLFFFLKAT